MKHIDYSKDIPWLDFKYDEYYYPTNLPDPQINPVIPGTKIPLQKVGITPVELPLIIQRRDGTTNEIYAKVSLYGSLDFEHAKGLNMSRFYILIHEAIVKENLSIDSLTRILGDMRVRQSCTSAYCKIKFSYRWEQAALRSKEKWGYIFYDCVIEGQLRENNEYRFYLTVNYRYSSSCPCSFTLAQYAMKERGKAANGHSQRSNAKITVEFDINNIVWIEDIVELARRQIPTEVVIYCKRMDEQAFAEANASNLLFTEDASRLLYEGLDEWYNQEKIKDFCIVTEHFESLHPFNAVAVVYKGVEGGLR